MSAITVEKITKVVNKALEDSKYADRLFKEPDAVAQENGLSEDEKLVLKQMNRQQFDTARKDAEEESGKKKSTQLSDKELGGVVGGSLNFTKNATAANMIVGRSLLGATGKNYASLAAAGCDCCAWKGGSIAGSNVINPGSQH